MARQASVLVTGGTGFLAPVVVYLIHRGYQVYVVGRQVERFKALQFLLGDKTERLVPLICDYADPESLEFALSHISHSPEISVQWIHHSFENGPYEMAKYLNQARRPHRYVHLLGHAAADPEANADYWREHLSPLKHIHYQRVILGFEREGDASRWLSRSELAKGVIHALKHPDQDHIIGRVSPWEWRPQ